MPNIMDVIKMLGQDGGGGGLRRPSKLKSNRTFRSKPRSAMKRNGLLKQNRRGNGAGRPNPDAIRKLMNHYGS